MFTLDWKLFGNGRGMKSPYWDDVFYWLRDTYGRSRNKAKGRFYRQSGWFGCQLASVEWRMPRPGERRMLAGYEFVVFSARRKWFRVEVSWAMTGMGRLTIDEQNERIRRMIADLGKA